MKPFLGIDLTTNKKNEQMNGEEFVIAKPALSLTQSLESSFENVEETIEKEFKNDQEQHAAYYAEFMLHLDSLYKRDRTEYAGVLTGLFLGNAYRAVDDELIELIKKNQHDHIKELGIND